MRLPTRLTYLHEGVAYSLDLADKLLSLGRSQDADHRLPGKFASRLHAEIIPSSSGWLIRDLGSSSGTFLNGSKIAAPVMLSHGDVVVIGDIKLKVEVQSDAPTPVPPPPSVQKPMVLPAPLSAARPLNPPQARGSLPSSRPLHAPPKTRHANPTGLSGNRKSKGPLLALVAGCVGCLGLGTILFVASSVGPRQAVPDKPVISSNQPAPPSASRPTEVLDEKLLRRSQARAAFLSDVSIPLGTVRTAASAIAEYAKTSATSTQTQVTDAESQVEIHRKEEDSVNRQIETATNLVGKLEAEVSQLRKELDAVKANQHPLSAYLVAYDAFVQAADANRNAALEVQSTQAALTTENDNVANAQDRLATVEQALKNIREDDDEGALRLAVDSARAELETAVKLRDAAEDKWGAAIDRLTRTVSTMEGASEELTELRRQLDATESRTAELLKSVSIFEDELVERAKSAKSVELAQKELDAFSRRSNDASRVYRDAEDQYYQALRRSGWFEADDYYRKLQARYRAGDGFDGIRKEDIERAKQNADRAYESAETERNIMQDARNKLTEEKANEAKLKKALSTATKAYKTASDRVAAAGKVLEKALSAARKAVGPEEEARLKQADLLSQKLTAESKKLEAADSELTEFLQKRERLVQARVKAQKTVEQLKKALESDGGMTTTVPLTLLVNALDDARRNTSEALDIDALEKLLSQAEKAVADERSAIRKVPKSYSDALRSASNGLAKISRLLGQLKADTAS